MDRRSQKATAVRPSVRVKRPPKKTGYAAQFLLVVSAGTLLIASLIAWKVYNDEASWSDWSTSVRSGLLGMRGSRSGDESEAQNEFESEPAHYLGAGYADLGEYWVNRYDSITNTTLTVNFQLKGMTPCQDAASFDQFMEENEKAFRDRVTQAVRDCHPSDYVDAKSMSKKVVVRVNRAFSGRFLESAELADFEVFESVGNYEAQSWERSEQVAVGM